MHLPANCWAQPLQLKVMCCNVSLTSVKFTVICRVQKKTTSSKNPDR